MIKSASGSPSARSCTCDERERRGTRFQPQSPSLHRSRTFLRGRGRSRCGEPAVLSSAGQAVWQATPDGARLRRSYCHREAAAALCPATGRARRRLHSRDCAPACAVALACCTRNANGQRDEASQGALRHRQARREGL